MAGFFGGVALLGGVWAGLIHLTSRQSAPRHTVLDWLVSIRALLGIQELPVEAGNTAQSVLSTIAAGIGAVLPAVVIAVLAIRLFTVGFLVWRPTYSHFPASDLAMDGHKTDDLRAGVLGIRFYKRIGNVNLLNVRVEAHLRFYEESPVDGTPYLRRRPIRMLDPNGTPTGSRVWPVVATALPLTLYIPTGSTYEKSAPAKLQDVEINGPGPYVLYVTVAGKLAGLGLEVTDAYEYDLVRDCQIGRPTPIDYQPDVAESAWRGWRRFEQPASVGIFLYDDLIDPGLIGTTLQRPVVRDVDYELVEVEGWKLDWTSVLGVESGLTKVALDLEREDSSVPRDSRSRVKGVLLIADRDEIERFVALRPGYNRVIVTNAIVDKGRLPVPDIVWALVATTEARETARAAFANGSARIDSTLSDRLGEAVKSYDTAVAKAILKVRENIPQIDESNASRD